MKQAIQMAYGKKNVPHLARAYRRTSSGLARCRRFPTLPASFGVAATRRPCTRRRHFLRRYPGCPATRRPKQTRAVPTGSSFPQSRRTDRWWSLDWTCPSPCPHHRPSQQLPSLQLPSLTLFGVLSGAAIPPSNVFRFRDNGHE